MAAKVIGFVSRVNGYRTRAGKMNNTLFVEACKKMAERTDVPYADYATKRQAGKFFKGQGIVFNEIVNS